MTKITLEELAIMVGRATETVIQLIDAFKNENLLLLEGKQIILLSLRAESPHNLKMQQLR
jgi:hypothetical protein